MCRFLMIKSKAPVRPLSFLDDFALRAARSRAGNGDRQEDGWGVSWLEACGTWRSRKSLRPIWEDRSSFPDIPESRFILVHARSASFRAQAGEIAYNQPFLEGPYAFVFNGFLQGVSLPVPAPGRIGAQKIWNLLKGELSRSSPAAALRSTARLLLENSRHVQALNIGLCDATSLFAFSLFTENPEYYTLHLHSSPALRMVASEPLEGLRFSPLRPGRIVDL